MVFGLSKNSYYKEEQKRIRELIKLPLVEQVLHYLPHLQPTESAQQDLWEMIAIQLNKQSFDMSVGSTSTDELPTLNGFYVKEVYEKIMEKFVEKIVQINAQNQVFSTARTHSSDSTGSLFQTQRFPIRANYTERADQILCELFYLRSAHIEILAKISKEKLELEYRKHHGIAVGDGGDDNSFSGGVNPSKYSSKHDSETADDQLITVDDSDDPTASNHNNASHKAPAVPSKPRTYSDTHTRLEKLKEQSELDKIKRYEEEMGKKNKRIDFLDHENKRLLELNHELVSQLQRGQSFERG